LKSIRNSTKFIAQKLQKKYLDHRTEKEASVIKKKKKTGFVGKDNYYLIQKSLAYKKKLYF